MATTETGSESAPAQEGLLTVAARTVGHAAGKAAKAIGLEHAEAKVHPARRPKTAQAKAPKRASTRLRRKDEAAELKTQAAAALKGAAASSKGAAASAAPYRRIMGKPSANWTAKDIGYIRGLIAKHSVGAAPLTGSAG